MLGMVWGLVPCGMVYGVLALALLAGDALNGAALALAFGLGTLPNLLGIGLDGIVGADGSGMVVRADRVGLGEYAHLVLRRIRAARIRIGGLAARECAVRTVFIGAVLFIAALTRPPDRLARHRFVASCWSFFAR